MVDRGPFNAFEATNGLWVAKNGAAVAFGRDPQEATRLVLDHQGYSLSSREWDALKEFIDSGRRV